jgi:hypothetical protein
MRILRNPLHTKKFLNMAHYSTLFSQTLSLIRACIDPPREAGLYMPLPVADYGSLFS